VATIGLSQNTEKLRISPELVDHNKLNRKGTSFLQVKDKLRRDIAIKKLTVHADKINDFSELLSFSEPRSFICAFEIEQE